MWLPPWRCLEGCQPLAFALQTFRQGMEERCAPQGPVAALAFEPGGNQMVTAGVDGQVGEDWTLPYLLWLLPH